MTFFCSSNYDEKTGIRYGVISPNSLNPETLNSIIDDSVDTIFEDAKSEFRQNLFDILNEWMSGDECDIIIDEACDRMSENYDNDNHSYHFKDKEYELHICDDGFGIFVIKSPFYTFTRPCSPCAPGAGDLNNPVDDEEYGGKTYCLPKDFFDNDEAPYKYYSVD